MMMNKLILPILALLAAGAAGADAAGRQRAGRAGDEGRSSSTSPAAAARRCRSPCPTCRRRGEPTPPPATPARSAARSPRSSPPTSRNSGLFTPIGPSGIRAISFPQVTAPDFPYFSTTGAQNLVQGFVQANANGSITVGCYLYDVAAQTELTRQGYVVQPRDWRRAAHRCADTIYSRLTGEGALFRHPHRLRLGDRDRRGGGSSGSR